MSLVDDKKISRDEFEILEKVSNDVKETNYLNHFKAADSTHDGYVTEEEMEQRFKQLGDKVSLDAMKAFVTYLHITHISISHVQVTHYVSCGPLRTLS